MERDDIAMYVAGNGVKPGSTAADVIALGNLLADGLSCNDNDVGLQLHLPTRKPAIVLSMVG
jgi:hypothetical protein